MAESTVKNVWDLLAAVRRRLAAGEPRVVFAWAVPEPDATHPDRATDDQGTAYDIGDDEYAELFAACRAARLSFALSRLPGQPATLTIGHHLPRPALPEGALHLDLTGHDVRIGEEFNPQDPAHPTLRIEARPRGPQDPAADDATNPAADA